MNNTFHWWYVNHKLNKIITRVDSYETKITFEMASFRRQIKELSKLKKGKSVVFTWGLHRNENTDTYEHILDFILIFEKYTVFTSYNSDTKKCSLTKYDTTSENPVIVDEIEFPVEETCQTLIKYFPKTKIVIKRK